MIRKLLLAGLLLGAATPALAQNGPPPSPYAPLQDHPVCTRDELKQLTAAYVEAQQKGSIAGLPLDPKVKNFENGKDAEAGAGMWDRSLPGAQELSL